MKTEPLSLEHRSLLEPRFQSLGLCLSEYSFASRFLFRREHSYQVAFDGPRIWLRGKLKDGTSYLLPTEDLQKLPSEILLHSLQGVDCFYPIPESWLPSFDPARFQSNYNRNDSDYFYKRDKIAEYPGRDLSPKRNLVKQFLEAYIPKVVPYRKEHLQDALQVLEGWQKDFKGEYSDYLACKDGLTLAQELNLSGILLYIEEQPAAFILGEIYHNRLFTIHFAKGLRNYKGIYPFIFKELASHLSMEEIEIGCLNWEQDLGQEGLRQSKLSYQPDKLVHKYRVGILEAV